MIALVALVAVYVWLIVAANVLLVVVGVVPVGFGLYAPAGVFAAGLTFTVRDAIQERGGRLFVLAAIGLGTLVSVTIDPVFGVASGVTFLVSEVADWLVYSRLRARGMIVAVASSNAIGLVIDSALFLQLVFGNQELLAGLIVGKMWMLLISLPWAAWRERRSSTSAVERTQLFH